MALQELRPGESHDERQPEWMAVTSSGTRVGVIDATGSSAKNHRSGLQLCLEAITSGLQVIYPL
eukprot:CAMPEP_0178463458 /NCGR_PEP_ID=MMETSP0689_2-20121128/50343_1 /TAXON_ID=160604 /ORGANISM="Amphidinium massartii, Strain CS-259" /LENGTH=63 /DNA_ID=CAMNT_0020090341 /DNA_START=346 /DNA_END=533 /DNA_ORIENTATION=-